MKKHAGGKVRLVGEGACMSIPKIWIRYHRSMTVTAVIVVLLMWV